MLKNVSIAIEACTRSNVHMQQVPTHIPKGLYPIFVYDIEDVESLECGSLIIKPLSLSIRLLVREKTM